MNAELKLKADTLIRESVTATPGRLSEINIELTAIKAYFSEQLDNILVKKADRLQELKVDSSVAAAKVDWNASQEGKEEILLRGLISRIKDQVSANKSRLRVKENEAFGSY